MIGLTQIELDLFLQEVVCSPEEKRNEIATQIRESFDAFILSNITIDEHCFDAILNINQENLKNVSEKLAQELIESNKKIQVVVPEVVISSKHNVQFTLEETSTKLMLSWELRAA